MLPTGAGDMESIVWGLILGGGGGAQIKQVQRGAVTFPQDGTSAYATISAIDPSKAFLVFRKSYAQPVPKSAGSSAFAIMGKIHGPTQIGFHRPAGVIGQTPIDWEVVEFARGISVQTVETSLADNVSSRTVTISPVDPARTFLIHSWKFQSGVGSSDNDAQWLHYNEPTVYLVDATTLTFLRSGSSNYRAIDVVVQVVEWR